MPKIQNDDIISSSELTTAGGSPSQLPNDSKIYVTAKGINKTLSQAITDGNVGSTVLADYGDGSDGDVTILSGTTSLVRDMYYNNLTINGTGSINANGYRIFVKETLDLTSAPENAIHRNGTPGNNATGATLGIGGTGLNSATVGHGIAGGSGTNGTTGAGTQANVTGNANPGNGGTTGGSGGAGGDGSAGVGGASRAGGTTSNSLLIRRYVQELVRGASLILGAAGGGGGASGGGDGTNSGRGGGGGGAGGGVIYIISKKINRGAGTAVGTISVNGGNGGNGASAAVGNTGGGGGGGGAPGGFVYIIYEELLGSTATNMIRANGGTGGNGGTGFGTGTNGTGGGGASSGTAIVYNVSNKTLLQLVIAGGSAATGTTGGTGATGLLSV